MKVITDLGLQELPLWSETNTRVSVTELQCFNESIIVVVVATKLRQHIQIRIRIHCGTVACSVSKDLESRE